MGRQKYFSRLLWSCHIEMICLQLDSSISNKIKNIDQIMHFPFMQKDNLDGRNPQDCVVWMCDLVKKIKIQTRFFLESEVNPKEQVLSCSEFLQVFIPLQSSISSFCEGQWTYFWELLSTCNFLCIPWVLKLKGEVHLYTESKIFFHPI